MAESTLTFSYSGLIRELGFFLGYGRDSTNWSTDQSNAVSDCLSSGLRQFYIPSPIGNERTVHRWSFLMPVTTIDMEPSESVYSDSDNGGDVDATGLQLSDSNIADWSSYFDFDTYSYHVVITEATGSVENGTYDISSIADDYSYIIPSSTLGGTGTCSYDVIQEARWKYDLSDDFGGLIAPFTFDENEGYVAVKETGESKIRQLRQQSSGDTKPTYFAVRPKTLDPTTGQRWEVLFWPAPDSDYTLTYRYRVNPDLITTTNKYPYGGMTHSETMRESCLAIAEQRMNGEMGIHTQKFRELLAGSIAIDRQEHSSGFLGKNTDNSDAVVMSVHRQNHYVTVNGVLR